MKYNAEGSTPNFSESDGMVIERMSQVRLRIKGIRGELGQMFAIGSIREDYLGYVCHQGSSAVPPRLTPMPEHCCSNRSITQNACSALLQSGHVASRLDECTICIYGQERIISEELDRVCLSREFRRICKACLPKDTLNNGDLSIGENDTKSAI